MEEQIEQAIRTTLVVTNKVSIKRCVEKIMKVVEQANQNKK